VVTLPVPAGTTFLDADNGGTSDGDTITWHLPPQRPCGVPGTPRCAYVIGRVRIDPQAVVGTFFRIRATGWDGDGPVASAAIKTTIGTDLPRRGARSGCRAAGACSDGERARLERLERRRALRDARRAAREARRAARLARRAARRLLRRGAGSRQLVGLPSVAAVERLERRPRWELT
jgi:hypothetical protein